MTVDNKMLSYRKEIALQGALVWPKVEWNWDTMFYGHYKSIFNQSPCKTIEFGEKNAE